MNNNLSKYFYLFLASTVFLSFFNSFFQPDLKIDGVLYEYLARNLYLGQGSFWFPYLSPDLWPIFSEHPPISINLMSLLYYLFGDFTYNGEIFYLLMFPLLMIPFYFIWKLIYQDRPQFQKHYWVFVLVFLSMPLTQTMYQKGYMEDVMAPFMAWAVYFYLRSMFEFEEPASNQNQLQKYGLLVLGSFLIFISITIKGPTALFPTTVPFFYMIFLRKKSETTQTNFKPYLKGFLLSAVSLSLALLFFSGLLFLNEEARESFRLYFLTRTGDASNDTYKFSVILRALKTVFINELSRPVLISLALWLLFKGIKLKKVLLPSKDKQWIKFLFALSLSGYLPLFLSPKVFGHYIFLCLSYATLAILMLILPQWDEFIENCNKLTQKIIKGLCVFSFIFAIVWGVNVFQNRKPTIDLRDIEKLTPILQETPILERGQLLLCPNLRDRSGLETKYGFPWYWHIYFKTTLNIDLLFEGQDDYVLGVIRDPDCQTSLPNHRPIEIDLEKYVLYKKIN